MKCHDSFGIRNIGVPIKAVRTKEAYMSMSLPSV